MHIGINAQLLSFNEDYRNGGISHYIYYLLRGLTTFSTSHTYTVFVNGAHVHEHFSESAHIKFINAPWNTTKPWERIIWEQTKLPRLIKKHNINILHSPANVLPEILTESCKSVVTIHDLAFLRYPHVLKRSKEIYHRLFTCRSLHRADSIISVSDSTKRDCMKMLRIPEERIHTVYPALNPDFFHAVSEQEIREFKHGHHMHQGYILYLGTLEPRKNLLVLIESFALLRKKYHCMQKLVLAGGKGWFYGEIFKLIHDMGLEEDILIAGYIPEKERSFWYAAADAFAFPSLYEGFGMPVVEALAYGIPTVTTNISSLPEAAHDLALTVNPQDTEELSNALFRMLSEDTLRATYKAHAKEVREFFSLQSMWMRTEQVYERVGY